MVLLTSSAVSVLISSSIVCLFTFLLFLSGYVLQQQTVRSLQEALQRPPEERFGRQFSQFSQPQQQQEQEQGSSQEQVQEVQTQDENKAGAELNDISAVFVPSLSEIVIDDQDNGVHSEREPGSAGQVVFDSSISAFNLDRKRETQEQKQNDTPIGSESGSEDEVVKEVSPLELWYDFLGVARPETPILDTTSENVELENKHENIKNSLDDSDRSVISFFSRKSQGKTKEKQPQRLAYILSIPRPSDLCSAILFINQHRLLSHLDPQPNIVLLYPSGWEMSIDPVHLDAMSLLRETEDLHSLSSPSSSSSDPDSASKPVRGGRLLYHPVRISKVWAGIDVEMQLFAEFARTPWNYERAMHLRSPGVALNINKLDFALSYSNVKEEWTKLKLNNVAQRPGRMPSLAGRGSGSGSGSGSDTVEDDKAEVVMFARGRGLQIPSPRRGLKRLTSSTAVAEEWMRRRSSSSSRGEEVGLSGIEALAREVAYITLDERDLEGEEGAKQGQELFDWFKRERGRVCRDTRLLDGER